MTIIQDGLGQLLEQFKRKPVIAAWLTSYLRQFDLLQVVTSDLRLLRTLEDATGEQLDVIGKIVGKARGALTDEPYRAWLRGKILANRSSGKARELVAIVKVVTDPTVRVRVRDDAMIAPPGIYSPATFLLEVLDPISGDVGTELAKLVALAARAAGVNGQMLWFDTAASFRFGAVSGTPEAASPNGFGAGRLAAASDGTLDIVFLP